MTTAMTIQLLIDNESLSRTEKGTISGLTRFKNEDWFFPDHGWTDMAVPLSTAWLDAVTRIALKSAKTERVWFFDGPFNVDLSSNGSSLVEVKFVHREDKGETVQRSGKFSIEGLLRDAISAGEQLITGCEQRGWADRDTEALSVATKRASDALTMLQTN